MSKYFPALRTLLTIIISLLIGIVAIVFTSSEPLRAIHAFFVGPFSNNFLLGNMLASSIPLIFTGLAASIAFTASAFNLGLEGQVYFSTLIGTFLAVRLSFLPVFVLITVIILTSTLVGGFIAALSGYLKAKWGVNELISSLLVSYTLMNVTDYFLSGPFKGEGAGMAASPYFSSKLNFTHILPPSNLHTGIFIALGAVLVVYLLFQRSNLGFEITLSGKNRLFSSYAGISVKRTIVISMFLSGALAGIAGIVDILGIHQRMIGGFSSGYGWNGIAVALIAKSNPLFVIPAALFFSFLESGANAGSLFADISPEVARIIRSVVFYLVTAEGLLSFVKTKNR